MIGRTSRLVSIAEDYERILAEDSDIREHMPYLKAAAERYEAPRIIELGVRTGRSTSAFLAGIGGGHLWSVDKDEAQVQHWWRDLDCWSFLQADDVSGAAARWLPDEADILFIDTSHEYEYTCCELVLYGPRVVSGGLILMHDTEWQPSGQPVGCYESTVGRALNWWCRRNAQVWENRPGCYGLGVVPVV